MNSIGFGTEIDRQLRETAQFVPAAFHIHSVDSHDWASRDGADRTANDPSLYRGTAGIQHFLDVLAQHFRIACVSDHMKCGYACELAIESLKRNDILVLPAMEVSCTISPLTEAIHLLAIFPPGTNPSTFEKLFSEHAQFPTEEKRNGKERVAICDLTQWIGKVHKENGLVILAHIQGDAGHRQVIKATLEGNLQSFLLDRDCVTKDEKCAVADVYASLLAKCKPDAVEIMNTTDKVHYVKFEYDGDKHCRMACVVRSDFHCIEDLASIQRQTYLKVARSDFDAVRDAFTFFETRIRFYDDLPVPSYPRIIGLSLTSPTGEGLFDNAAFGFNENLNCFIGPRGSGKSTVIEAMRYVLGANADFAKVDEWATEQPAKIAQQIQQANLKGTLIKLFYERAKDEYYQLSTTFDGRNVVPRVDVIDQNGRALPVESTALTMTFPARIYSWSQIESIGRRQESQRALVDRLIPDVAGLLAEEGALYRQLAENRAEVSSVTTRMDNKLQEQDGLAGRYVQYKAEFDRVNTPEVAQLFENLDNARQRVNLLQQAVNRLMEFLERIKELDTPNALRFSPDFGEPGLNSLSSWWSEEIEPVISLAQLAEDTGNHIAAIRTLVSEKLSVLTHLLSHEVGVVAKNESEIRLRTQSDPESEISRDRREQARIRYEAAVQLRDEYLTLYSQFRARLEARELILQDIERIRESVAEKRASSQQLLLSRLAELRDISMDIQICFVKGADRRAVVSFMEEKQFLKREFAGQYKNTNYAQRLCSMATPINIGRALVKQDRKFLEVDGVRCGANVALSKDEANKLMAQYATITSDPGLDATKVDAEKMALSLQLQEVPWNDTVSILLDGESVDKKSPGQRSSAMLPLVALSETVPLVVDQPEDNLDNRLVGHVLTQVFARLKETRQIIIATHSPNIVVGGDAEQVIVLDAVGSAKAEQVATGSIDSPTIVRAVIDIMEGGKEAFEARGRRYQPHL